MTKFKKLVTLIVAFVNLTNFKKLRIFLQAYKITKFDYQFLVSYSQCAEDLSLLIALENIKNGTYIDIGAHHPSRYSNTRLLYDQGWSGVNIDANPDLIKEFQIKRKRDVNLFRAVGSLPEYKIAIFTESAVSTVVENWEIEQLANHRILDRYQVVKGITLREVFDKYFLSKECDLLSIDIEGADFEALKSIEFQTLAKNRYPNWILVETSPPVSKSLAFESVRYAIQFGYIPYFVLPAATLLKKEDNIRI